jgi:hypothetical protein
MAQTTKKPGKPQATKGAVKDLPTRKDVRGGSKRVGA